MPVTELGGPDYSLPALADFPGGGTVIKWDTYSCKGYKRETPGTLRVPSGRGGATCPRRLGVWGSLGREGGKCGFRPRDSMCTGPGWGEEAEVSTRGVGCRAAQGSGGQGRELAVF